MRIFFSVGEPSGDLHGSRLMRELQRRHPGVECVGFGGPLMEREGGNFLFRLTEMAVMGFIAVIPMLWKFYQLYRRAKRNLAEQRPDAVILIDFPGFNWWIAKAAKRQGIPVFYYLPPQLWGWAPWRVKRVKKFVDHVLCALPFEQEWFRQHGVTATEYVGHPFFDEVAERTIDRRFIASVTSGKAGVAPLVAILPGSRGHEVRQNFPVQLEIMQRLYRCLPGVQFVVANYKESQRDLCKQLLKEKSAKLPVRFFVGRTSDLIEACDAGLLCSGSVSLEFLARAKPAVVVYRIPRLYHRVAKFVLTCRFITLPNLMADRMLYPEYLTSGDPAPVVEDATNVLLRWLIDGRAAAEVTAAITTLRSRHGASGATSKAAAAILRKIAPQMDFGSEQIRAAA
jgi:lipid-A-disaccharide synthase